MILILRVGSHGVPSPKSHSCQQVPTCESQEIIKIRSIFITVISLLFYAKELWNLCWELCLAFCSTQLSAQVPSLTSINCCRVGIHGILELRTWDPMWSGKSQLPCSQQLRLHGLTSNDLGLRTWDPMWTSPNTNTLETIYVYISS